MHCLFIVLSKTDIKGTIQHFTEINIEKSTIFANSENRKTSDSHRLRLNVTDMMDFIMSYIQD